MSKYIDAEKLQAEIERLRDKLMWGSCGALIQVETNCKNEAYNELLEIITSLQQEQPEGGSSEKPNDHLSEKQKQPEVDLERDAVQFCFDKGLNVTPYQAKTLARHFYELGLNARKKE